jgi:ABC-type lipoprotein release transport system permease subunit
VAIFPSDQYMLLAIMTGISVAASLLGIRKAVGVDPTTALGGGA